MKLALQAKRKLGFVTGDCKKENYRKKLHEHWETCNAIVLSWIINTVSKDLVSSIVYASNAHHVWEGLHERFDKELWAEFNTMTPSPDCGCDKEKECVDYPQQQRLLQFLSRLNEVYDQSRRQILMKTTEPTLNQAYAMIIENESQRSNPYPALTVRAEPMFKSSGRGDPNPLAMQAKRGQPFKEDQYKQILELLNKGNTLADQNLEKKHVNMIGKSVSLMLGLSCVEWIVDSGASHHIFANIDALDSIKELCSNKGNQVCMPTGRKSEITHIGNTSLSGDLQVKNVLHVPEFKYNLLSVSKLTKELSCSVKFFPDFCVFQDVYSGRVRGIVKKSEGLYIIKKNNDAGSKKVVLNTTKENMVVDRGLWHMRLGYVSVSTMKNVKYLQNKVIDIAVNSDCSVCPMAKQNRLMFPRSTTRSDNPLSLLHMDVWGPYKYPTHDRKYFFLTIVNDNSRSSTSPDIVMPSLDIVTEVADDAADTADTEEGHDMDQHIEDYDKVDNNNGGTEIYNSNDLVATDILDAIEVGEMELVIAAPQPINNISTEVRRSIRNTKEPLWYQDYVLTKKKANGTVKYSLSDHLAYKEISQRCKVFLANISALVEPASFVEASKDQRWIEVMNLEVKALEDNNTWQVVDLPKGKNAIGSKWASRQWNNKLTEPLTKDGYRQSLYDYSLLTKQHREKFVEVLIYVDDLLITENNEELIRETNEVLKQKFKVKGLDLGLGEAKPVYTPIDLIKNTSVEYDKYVGIIDDPVLEDVTKYQRLIKRLIYVAVTRPDIVFVMQTLSQFMHTPKRSHWDAAIRIMRNVKQSPGMGVLLSSKGEDHLIVFCDADWASCPNTRRSVIGYVIKDNLGMYAEVYLSKFILGYCSTYIFVQTFMIPGTIFMSLLAGALFGIFRGLLLVVFNATAGASSCYFLSKLIGRPIVNWMCPEKLRFFSAEIAKRRDKLLNYMLFLRITPTLPYLFINLASPIVDIPFYIFFFATVICLIPAAYITIKAGLTLGELKSVKDFYDFKTLSVLFLIGALIILPTILKRKRIYE
ncbi:putative NAC domain-containing protein 43-like [Capsicum annuum]|nr:putative NAC domain-containing protein 43-like [Capsicum annuum]KAF3646608.1 putative NAC domain-containing protein 43-like [Capsicum annuum]